MPINEREFLNVGLVLDGLIAVTSCKSIATSTINTDPFKSLNSIDENAHRKLTLLRMQGWPNMYAVIQDFDTIPHGIKNVDTYVKMNMKDELRTTDIFFPDSMFQLMRQIAVSHPPDFYHRVSRSYMYATQISKSDKDGIQISGYIHGNFLCANRPIHITDIGDFNINRILIGDDPCPVKKAH